MRANRSVRAALPVIVLFSAGLMAWRADDDLFELRRNFEIFGAVYEELVVGYVNDIRPQPFMRAGIDAMLAELDPYTIYYDEADLVDAEIRQQSSSATVGISLGERAGRLTVLEPGAHASAYRQGVRVGDVVVQIDGTDAASLSIQEAYSLMGGEPGTTVSLVLERTGEQATRTFLLPRERFRQRNVSWSGYLGPDTTARIGYVRLDQFGERSGREVRRTLRNMSLEAGLNGVVLDLRGNPGGIVSEAIDIVELFVPAGSPVVSIRSRSGEGDETFRTEMDPLFPDIPVVVLVNAYSASASEIVSGALQDLDRAVVMGHTTFGKGLVQQVRRLPHNTAMKITIAHYVLPSGRSIHSSELNTASSRVAVPESAAFDTQSGRRVRSGHGVEPDVMLDEPFESELETALREDGAFFQFADRYAASACADGPTCMDDRTGVLTAFRDDLDARGFSFETEAERRLNAVSRELETAGWSGPSDAVASLHASLDAEKRADFDRHADRFFMLLQAELRTRLYDEVEQARQEVARDAWIAEAAGLVGSPGDWRVVLTQ